MDEGVWVLHALAISFCRMYDVHLTSVIYISGDRTFFELVCAALDSDDLLYLKEQMEAEEDAERLLRRTEKRAFAAFKISFLFSLEPCGKLCKY